VHIACSTLCFASLPLDLALRRIADLEFSKVELALLPQGQLQPTEVAASVEAAQRRVRLGPSLSVAALYLDLPTDDSAENRSQLEAVFKFAKALAATCVTIPVATVGTDWDHEVQRLRKYRAIAAGEGLTLCVENHVGRLAQDPATAVKLCEAVRGLGLTLDPGHYVNGPHQNRDYDAVFPFVQHVQLRDAGTAAGQAQVQVGRGKIEYSRVLAQLERCHYDRTLSIEIIDEPGVKFEVETEVRKLKLLLESLM
jgi:sugar phosphate isomerase/epimerase